jgi:hypothetical protein
MTEQQILFLIIGVVILYYMYSSKSEKFSTLTIAAPGQPPIGWFISDNPPNLKRVVSNGNIINYAENAIFARNNYTPPGLIIRLSATPGKPPNGFVVTPEGLLHN